MFSGSASMQAVPLLDPAAAAGSHGLGTDAAQRRGWAGSCSSARRETARFSWRPTCRPRCRATSSSARCRGCGISCDLRLFCVGILPLLLALCISTASPGPTLVQGELLQRVPDLGEHVRESGAAGCPSAAAGLTKLGLVSSLKLLRGIQSQACRSFLSPL